MISIQKYISFLVLFTIICGLVLKTIIENFGVSIGGLDYVIWMLLIVQIWTINILNKSFYISQNYLFVFLLIIVFTLLNYFTSNYSNSIVSYLIGSTITFIFPITFIAFYNLDFSIQSISNIIKSITFTITTLLIILLIERIFNGSFLTTEKIPSKIIKTYGFIGTLSSINIPLALFLYHGRKEKKYIFVILFSLLMIGHLVMLKSILSALLVLFLYYALFMGKNILKKMIYVMLSIVMLIIVAKSNEKIDGKIEKYKKYYLNSSGENLTPRLALYREAIHIAQDHFPFGSGQGTYGSFPVMKHYNDVYKDYGLSHTHGLIFNKKPNFLFDSYWSSIIGEMGFIASFLYIMLFFYPLFVATSFLKIDYLKHIAFVIIAILSIIFIESLALAIPYQISFIIIYAGLTGILVKYLKSELSNKESN